MFPRPYSKGPRPLYPELYLTSEQYTPSNRTPILTNYTDIITQPCTASIIEALHSSTAFYLQLVIDKLDIRSGRSFAAINARLFDDIYLGKKVKIKKLLFGNR